MLNPSAFSKQNCGDGIRVNLRRKARWGSGTSGSSAGRSAASIRLGTVLRASSTASTWRAALAACAAIRRIFTTTAVGVLDRQRSLLHRPTASSIKARPAPSTAMANGGVIVNDTLASGGTVDLAGWEASTQAGHGIVSKAWNAGDVEIRGDKVYNNCGSACSSRTRRRMSSPPPQPPSTATGPPSAATRLRGLAGRQPGHAGSRRPRDFKHLVAGLALREFRRPN